MRSLTKYSIKQYEEFEYQYRHSSCSYHKLSKLMGYSVSTTQNWANSISKSFKRPEYKYVEIIENIVGTSINNVDKVELLEYNSEDIIEAIRKYKGDKDYTGLKSKV